MENEGFFVMKEVYGLLLGLLTIISGCDTKQNAAVSSSPPPTVPVGMVVFPPDSPKLQQIRVETLELTRMPVEEITAPGKVEANSNRISRLPLPVPGRITRVMVSLGDSIAAGQPVLLIESPDANEAEANYSQSQALINQAEATLAQAKAGMAKAKADYDRTADLIEHDAIAQKEVINTESVYKQAKAVVDQAAAAVEQARVARQQALKKLNILGLEPGNSKPQLAVRAPLAGKVLEISVVAGEYRNDTTAPVMTIADLR
ncbi:MAG: efflux RND transporter periplasmic adaptor subunit, partial [Blastocatellia bacterium]|nr:efflux RND transporter periplasmic adaptor subunit [Blastocatellia bacterium]